MARIRTIKPEFWTSQTLGSVSPRARLLFLALISTADDHGRGGAVPKVLARTLFPFDDDATWRMVQLNPSRIAVPVARGAA